MSSTSLPGNEAASGAEARADEGGCLHLECGGNLDYAALAEGAEPLAASFGPDVYGRRVLLNCEKLGLVDTSGISWLLDCHKRFAAGGGMLVLYAVPPLAEQLLRLLQLDRLLHIQPDRAAARALAGGGKS